MSRIRHILALVALVAALAPSALRAEQDTVGVFCPFDFNRTFNKEVLANQLRQGIERNTILPGADITREVHQLEEDGSFYGNEDEAIIQVARARGYRKVLVMLFVGNDSQFMLMDIDHPDEIPDGISASLPEDITQEEFTDLINQVTSSLLHDYAAADGGNLPYNISKL